MRRAAALLLALSLVQPTAGARGAGTPEPRAQAKLDRREAIKLGLEYLKQIQNRDGSWGRGQAGIVGITALGVLAFFAAGHELDRGRYQKVLRNGVDYLRSCSLAPNPKDPAVSVIPPHPPGYFYARGDSDSKMHGHGYATQALVLAYGTGKLDGARSKDLKHKLHLAIRIIEDSQTITGGWGYDPNRATAHEGSVTVTQVQALRLAANAGFLVDMAVIRAGLKYLHDSQKKDGSFRYSINNDRSSAALTAASLTAMHGFGEYYSDATRAGLTFLFRAYRRPRQVQWGAYAHYYTAQALYRAQGEYWQRWKELVEPYLLSKLNTERGGRAGYWDDREFGRSPNPHGRAYGTASICLALSVEDGLLPLFQR